ncbi:uncharacterized protein TRAVEDRAFT_117305 [Trametes versicolor FP-101664 SS1]|uniref:uncharacterized protein n=1 Tax=Trametes versicolor (strain FP-101664) TaxID=717944 RepID=UPI0004621CB6|nr:uncharacterized protein TRAVEDRAFT_117305 [Trametes versicolor FP-101664 SS1]EIW62080.1 hypothetical protein TRAVEDRAFT_117305 [Trametes versicolor FP-101664 SS1]
MAKSTRSKVKRSFRAKKRTDGVYAAVEAARLNRLHNKLKAIATTDLEVADEEDDEMEEGARMETEGDAAATAAGCTTARISTHGPRNSRRESWRESKGLVGRPKVSSTMNRQGVPAARRKAGRSHRRR